MEKLKSKFQQIGLITNKIQLNKKINKLKDKPKEKYLE